MISMLFLVAMISIESMGDFTKSTPHKCVDTNFTTQKYSSYVRFGKSCSSRAALDLYNKEFQLKLMFASLISFSE